MNITIELLCYMVDYINEELDRGNKITLVTLQDALEAYEGGAR